MALTKTIPTSSLLDALFALGLVGGPHAGAEPER